MINVNKNWLIIQPVGTIIVIVTEAKINITNYGVSSTSDLNKGGISAKIEVVKITNGE